MSHYTAEIAWHRDDAVFTDHRYSRGHRWRFDGGLTVPASSAPQVVRTPYSVAGNVDPEEAFVAALSSCHMLFYLDLAAREGLVVDSYVDQAEGEMREVDGVTKMTLVSLNPRVTYAGDTPDRKVEENLHHRAHALCFLANSVTCAVETRLP